MDLGIMGYIKFHLHSVALNIIYHMTSYDISIP